MNDPDEHTLDEAWGEDPAVPDQARVTLRWVGFTAASGAKWKRCPCGAWMREEWTECVGDFHDERMPAPEVSP